MARPPRALETEIDYLHEILKTLQEIRDYVVPTETFPMDPIDIFFPIDDTDDLNMPVIPGSWREDS